MNTKKSIKIMTIFLVVLIVMAGTVVYAAYHQYGVIKKNPMSAFIPAQKSDQTASQSSDSITNETTGSSSAAAASETASPEETPVPTEGKIAYKGTTYLPNKNVINILLLGIDWDATRQDMGWRSDMNMLCTVDFAQKKLTLTGIPRDTRTKIYYLNLNNGKIKTSGLDKINAAYSYGGGPDKYGPQNAMRSIGEFLSIKGKYDVPIDYYMSIDLQGIPRFASALGGIQIKLDVNFPGLGKRGDTIILNEANSRAYLENRKKVGGDLVRISHEQQYLMAVAQKIKQKGAVASAPSLYANLIKFMHTNLSLEQIIALAQVLDTVDVNNITLQTIAGNSATIDDISYFIADGKDVESKVVELMYTPYDG